MKENQLDNQDTFFKHTDGYWYDGLWDFKISFDRGICALLSHNEVDGSTWFLKYIKDLDDLKRVFEAITDKKFI